MCQNWDGQLSALLPQNPGPAFSRVWGRQKAPAATAEPLTRSPPLQSVCAACVSVQPLLQTRTGTDHLLGHAGTDSVTHDTRLLTQKARPAIQFCGGHQPEWVPRRQSDSSLTAASLGLQAEPDFSRRLALLQGLADYAVNRTQETLNEDPNS